MTQRLPRPALTPLPEETARRQAEDAALTPQARAFLSDNQPLLHRPWSAFSAVALRQKFHRHFAAKARSAARALGVRVQMAPLGLRLVPPGGGPQRVLQLFGRGHANGGSGSDLGIMGGLA